MSYLDDVKLYLAIEDDSRDTLLNKIIENVTSQLLTKLDADTEVPSSLAYIVTEVSVSRFNRLSSEAMDTESVDGHSVKYTSDDFARFKSDIQRYNDKNAESGLGKVRFK